MSLRIIGGSFGGRIISSPKGDLTRPSSSLLRKAFFDICQDSVGDADFLDLFAGSGAMGIEAISRGAHFSTFVDKSANACQVIKKNIELLEIEGQTEVLCMPSDRALELFERKKRKFHLIFIDPPYGKDFLPPILQKIVDAKLLQESGRIFAEESAKATIPQLASLKLHEERRYGDTVLLEYSFVNEP